MFSLASIQSRPVNTYAITSIIPRIIQQHKYKYNRTNNNVNVIRKYCTNTSLRHRYTVKPIQYNSVNQKLLYTYTDLEQCVYNTSTIRLFSTSQNTNNDKSNNNIQQSTTTSNNNNTTTTQPTSNTTTQQSLATNTNTDVNTVSPTTSTVPALPLSTRVWNKVKSEAKHYWHGTKLLAAETRISWYIVRQVLRGHELTRRERKQLQRTASDLIRLVPFLGFVLIPFAEFALPLVLKLFPNALPSTYIDHSKDIEKQKKQLAMKIDMAKFLQETTVLMTNELMARKTNDNYYKVSLNEFNSLMNDIKNGNTKNVTMDELAKYSALFNEEFTLENLNKKQLTAMCELLEIRPFGNQAVLRHKLQTKIRTIRKDDKQIDKETVNSLSYDELIEACRERGIHTGKGIEYMRRKLNEWIQLSIYLDVPISLLILSRAFSAALSGKTIQEIKQEQAISSTQEDDFASDLAATIAHLPEQVVKDTEHEIVNRSVTLEDKERKLELLRQEQEKVEQERMLLPQQGKAAVTAPIDLVNENAELDDVVHENDEVERDIDTVDGQNIMTAQSQSQSQSQSQQQTTIVSDKKLDKEEKRVDTFNDKIEQYVDDLKKELDKLSKQELIQRLIEEQHAKEIKAQNNAKLTEQPTELPLQSSVPTVEQNVKNPQVKQ